MRDQVLSIDQMKHLKDLNIDTSEATLYWTRRCHGCKIDDDSTGEWSYAYLRSCNAFKKENRMD